MTESARNCSVTASGVKRLFCEGSTWCRAKVRVCMLTHHGKHGARTGRCHTLEVTGRPRRAMVRSHTPDVNRRQRANGVRDDGGVLRGGDGQRDAKKLQVQAYLPPSFPTSSSSVRRTPRLSVPRRRKASAPPFGNALCAVCPSESFEAKILKRPARRASYLNIYVNKPQEQHECPKRTNLSTKQSRLAFRLLCTNSSSLSYA
jgi:hypothetical protein